MNYSVKEDINKISFPLFLNDLMANCLAPWHWQQDALMVIGYRCCPHDRMC